MRGVTDNTFMMTLFTRIVILAIAAVSLNLIMGFGGMVSFGHAAYLGIGGYAVGILAQGGHRLRLHPMAARARRSRRCSRSAIGALSLRTRGVYFIMITLAFAQMVYYVADGLDRYGGDDGLTIQKRSQFARPAQSVGQDAFYYLCLMSLFGDDLSGLAHGQFALRPGRSRAPAPTIGACTRSASRPSATS